MTDILALWGKSNRQNSSLYHPLLFHSIDSGMVAHEIWEQVMAETTKEQIALSAGISKEQIANWLAFFVSCHDIGKASPGFQGLIEEHASRLSKEGLKLDNYITYHNVLSTKIILEEGFYRGTSNLMDELRYTVAFAIGGHHGYYSHADDIGKIHDSDLGDKLWEKIRLDILDYLAELFRIKDEILEIDQDYVNNFFIILSGLTSVADWIASSDDYFDYAPKCDNPKRYAEVSCKRAKDAISNLHWNTGTKKDVKSMTFETLFPGYKPNSLQRKAISLSKSLTQPSLVIIEAPMGMGKTEAALYLEERLAQIVGVSGYYVALPTQATADEMFRRVKDFASNQKNTNAINLHLIHGHAVLSDQYSQLKTNGSEEYEPEQQYVLVADDWFTYNKRGLLSPLGVGTIDQVLLSVLPTKHFFVRLFGLAGKVVIIDEVHAYDIYTSTLIDRTIEWLRALGTSIILLSATLPSQRRNQLMERYGGKIDESYDARYPRISWVSGKKCGIESFKPRPEDNCEKIIDIKWIDKSDLSDSLISRLKDGGSVAIVCNTVSSAQQRYLELSNAINEQSVDIDIDLLHARYPFENKKIRVERNLKKFGKDRDTFDKPSILVATQIIEQSLDLDFDLMITELAPVDLVLQRVGRLHRHQRERPSNLLKPELWILNPIISEGRFKFGPEEIFYSEYILLRSKLILDNQNRIEIPSDIETLVESLYGDDNLTDDSTILNRLGEIKSEWEDSDRTGQDKAKVFLVKSPDVDEFWEHLHYNLRDEDSEAHQSLQAKTRDTQPNVTIACLYDTEQGPSLDSDGNIMVDVQKVPDIKMTKMILYRSLSISHQGIYHILRKEPVPDGWKQSSLLRNHKLILFSKSFKADCYSATCGNYKIILDDELGLKYEKGENR